MSTQLIIKYLVSAALITTVSELSKKNNALAALVGSLPWTTMLVLIWMHVDKAPAERIGSHSFYTFWYVLPTLPMFLVVPWLLKRGWHFWPTLAVYAAGTWGLFFLLQKVGAHWGLKL